MIKESKRSQYGQEGLIVEGIVLHETNNYTMTAQEIFDYLNGDCKTSQGCHFIISNEGIIEVMPLNWKVWSSGKGNDWCFEHCIAIEIHSNINEELYEEGLNKAIELIQELKTQYNLTNEQIYGHCDFNNQAYCPSNILTKYGSVKRFVIERIG